MTKTTIGTAAVALSGTMSDFETYSISTVSTSYPLFSFQFTTSNAFSFDLGYLEITYPS